MKYIRLSIYIIIYGIGIMLTGLGAISIIRSELGAGAWDTVNNNLSIFAHITKGTAGSIVNILILLFLIFYRKKYKFFFVLVPILGIALAVDFWDLLIFKTYYPLGLFTQMGFFTGGVAALSFGLALLINSPFPAGVFDELTLAFMEIFKSRSFFKTRIFIEVFAVMFAIVLGYMAGIGLGAVSYGSVILAFVIGPIINAQVNFTKRFYNLIEVPLLLK